MKKSKKSDCEEQLQKQFIEPLVEAAVQEKPLQNLESPAHFQERLQHQITDALHTFQERFQAAIGILKNKGEWPEIAFPEELPPPSTPLQEVFHLSDENLQAVYQEGWNCHQRGAYEEAANLFLLLTQLNPKIGAFWSALGAAEEKRGAIESAAHAYLFACELEQQTVAPYLHAAKCLVHLNRREKAEQVLQRALERSDQEPPLKVFKKFIEKMQQLIHR